MLRHKACIPGALNCASNNLFYYSILITHIILAVAIIPLALRTFQLALIGRFITHKKWARVTFPLWLYVSVTGVLIYFFLYVWYT